MPNPPGWTAYSSYDLSDRRDGASQHLAEIFAVLGPALSAETFAMKRIGGWPRTSLGHALRTALVRLGTRPWRDPRAGLLLGMHSLFLAPFFAPSIYVPLDCWSAREAALAARSRGLRGALRRLYAAGIVLSERMLLRYVARILVVSEEERAAYGARYPHLADRVTVMPLRLPPVSARANPPPPAPDCAVVVWMVGRVGYGRQSIIDCLACLDPWPDLAVTILSRCEDLGLPLRPNQRNLAFVDDLDSFLRQQALVILPDNFGSGIKNRALEAGARGIPLLATPAALEGLGWTPAECYVLAYSNRDSFRAAMEHFLDHGSTMRAQALLERLAEEAIGAEARLLSVALLPD